MELKGVELKGVELKRAAIKVEKPKKAGLKNVVG